jgi:hypothetical protein
MNPKLKPRFDRERFGFFRREHAGYASAISPEDPTKALHILNPTVVDVADQCTGEATVGEIRTSYAARYQQDGDGPLARYVDDSIFMLALYNLVTFELPAEEPRTAGEPLPAVRRLEEWDLKALRWLFGGGGFPEKQAIPIVHYRHPYVLPEIYSELMLRQRIFQQREFFYAITRADEIDFVVSFFDERPMKPMASIGTIVGVSSYPFEEGMRCVFPVIEKDLAGHVFKLEWRHVTGSAEVDELKRVLGEVGFVHDATIPDEFGPGRGEEIWGKVLPSAPPL